VELYGLVRYAVQREGLSRREAARRFGLDPRTVAKMLARREVTAAASVLLLIYAALYV
jgi:transposase